MPKPSAYDLFVLLDLESPDERRAAVIDQIRNQLQQRGTLKGDVDWGSRKLAYEIDHRGEAQYHLFQFEAAPDLLAQLNRSLSIDDSVLRHRIIKLPGEAPEVTPRPAEEAPRRPDDRERPRDRRDEREGVPEGESVPEGEIPAAEPQEEELEPSAAEGAPAAEAPAAEQPPDETA